MAKKISLKTSHRLTELDLIRVFSILAVVTVHVTDAIVGNTGYFGGFSWWIANILNSSLRIGVPLFLAISGYIFLEKPSKAITYSRIVNKTVVPLIVWSIVYLFWNNFWKGISYTPIELATLIFAGKFLHLYFMFIIIGVYASFPIISSFFWGSSQKNIKLIILSLIGLGGIMTLIKYQPINLILIRNVFTIFIPYIGFFLYGGYVRRFKLLRTFVSNKRVFVLISLLVLSCLLSFANRKLINSGILIFGNGTESQYFGEHFSPNMALVSLLVFPILLSLTSKISSKLERFSGLIQNLAKASFGIYLLHIMMIDLVDHYANMAVHLVTSHLWTYIFEKVGLVYLITLVVVLGLTRIPLIKRSLGAN